ncbi:MAG TPA: GH25 family lysozyme [Thermoanaerobaculia bacterium]|nr:GH25 family lysozyme [Thermoanaerobaculia bacterium]
MSNGNAQGIDVSHYQGTVNWPEVRQAGIEFAFAKATDGLTWTDPQFADNRPAMKAAGLLRGAYHFFEPADDAAQQAQFFLQTVQLAAGDLPPALDVETAASSAMALWEGVETWLQTVAAATGVQPFLYVDPTFADEYEIPASLAAYPLWIAEYDVAQPTLPEGWSTWLIWQQSESGTVSGVTGTVDLDVLNGPIAKLVALTLA